MVKIVYQKDFPSGPGDGEFSMEGNLSDKELESLSRGKEGSITFGQIRARRSMTGVTGNRTVNPESLFTSIESAKFTDKP